MSSTISIIKRHNHRIHPCKNEKKPQLLDILLNKYSDKKIVVVASTKTEITNNHQNVIIVSDDELIKNPDIRCELLISYDLPQKATAYMNRLKRTDTYATIMLDSSEEKLIHPIETLIGRTIMQELVDGISEFSIVKQAQPIKKEARPRSDKKFDDKPKKSYPKSKKRKESKYLGKDENGKAIFSGKSGERNHRYDGTPKQKSPKLTGKKIDIKSLKKKEGAE